MHQDVVAPATINVLADGEVNDVLSGNAGDDWFFAALDDVINDLAFKA